MVILRLDAVATLAGYCDSLDLYGFSGAGTIDGHTYGLKSPGHDVSREHAFLGAFANATCPASWRVPALEALLGHGERGTLRIHR